MRTLVAALILISPAFADSSVFQSTDGGQSWQVILSGSLTAGTAFDATTITVDPANPEVLYLGAASPSFDNRGTVIRSTDAGGSWSYENEVYCGYVDSLLVDPSSSQTLYLSAAGCLAPKPFGDMPIPPTVIKSIDGGTNWTVATNGLPLTYQVTLAIDPQTPTSLFAGTGQGLFKSTDGAATWSPTGLVSKGADPSYPVDCVAVDPSNAATVYACAQGQLMKSTDGGASWASTTAALGSGLTVFAMDPRRGSSLYVFIAYANSGVSGIFSSQDGGATWTPGTLPAPLTQIKSLMVDQSASSRIWASSDRGLQVSNDAGATWGAVAAFPQDIVTALAADPTGAVYVATSGPSYNPVRVDHINSAASSSIQIAPGEIVSVYGQALAGGTASATGPPPLPTKLLDASVLFLGASLYKPAPLFYVSGGQINVQIPFETPSGNTWMGLSTSVGSVSVPIQIVPAAPAIFTLNMQGTGQGAIEHGLTYALVTDLNPAAEGEIITIYCTGLGVVSPRVATGAAATSAAQTVLPVQVSIGGNQAQVFYAGVTPGFAGLYQINVQVPPGTPSGAQPVVVAEHGVTSNTVTVAVQ